MTKHDDNASKEVGQLFLLSGVISVVDWGKSITFHYNVFRSYITYFALTNFRESSLPVT